MDRFYDWDEWWDDDVSTFHWSLCDMQRWWVQDECKAGVAMMETKSEIVL